MKRQYLLAGKIQKIFALAMLVFLFIENAGAEDTISIQSLGQLRQKYIQTEVSDSYRTQPVAAFSATQPGSDYKIISPFTPYSIKYLHPNGSLLQEESAFVQLSGSEIHHFLETLRTQKELYEIARKRYETNRKLYDKKSISGDKWFEIVRQYDESKMQYGHLRHFEELIHTILSEDSIIVKTPVKGILIYSEEMESSGEETELGRVVEDYQLRLKLQMSASSIENLSSVITNSCELSIEIIESVANGMNVTLWSEPITENCGILPGQTVSVIPQYSGNSYLIPKSAIYMHERNSFVFIKENLNLVSKRVNILSSDALNYRVETEEDISNKDILIESVSAVHGILQGLGGE